MPAIPRSKGLVFFVVVCIVPFVPNAFVQQLAQNKGRSGPHWREGGKRSACVDRSSIALGVAELEW